jgi:hypothetical protein
MLLKGKGMLFGLMIAVCLGPATDATAKSFQSEFCRSLKSSNDDYVKERTLCDAHLDFVNARFMKAKEKLERLLKGKFHLFSEAPNPSAKYLYSSILSRGPRSIRNHELAYIMNNSAMFEGSDEAKASQLSSFNYEFSDFILKNKTGKYDHDLKFHLAGEAAKIAMDIADTYPRIVHRARAFLFQFSVENKDIPRYPQSFVIDAANAGVADAMVVLALEIWKEQISVENKNAFIFLWAARGADHGQPLAMLILSQQFSWMAENLRGKDRSKWVRLALGWLVLAEKLETKGARTLHAKLLSAYPSASLSDADNWAEKWLKNHYAKSGFEIGIASKWCGENGISPNKCMPSAVAEDRRCFVFLPEKYIAENYRKTEIYNKCRWQYFK